MNDIIEIGNNFFKNSTGILSINSLFLNNTNLTKVGSGFLSGSLVTTASGLFSGCSNLVTVGEDILTGNNIITVDEIFMNCIKFIGDTTNHTITNYFINCPNISSIIRGFYGCTLLDGVSPGIDYKL